MHDDELRSDRVDFSALGPPIAADRLDALVAATVQRGADELARRARGGVIGIVVAWRRPVLALSALAAAAAVLTIVRRPASQLPAVADSNAPATVAEALGIPSAYAYKIEASARSGASDAERP